MAQQDMQLAAATAFLQILQDKLVPLSTYTQTFLQTILTSVDSKDAGLLPLLPAVPHVFAVERPHITHGRDTSLAIWHVPEYATMHVSFGQFPVFRGLV